ncbi:MAG: hypothetical protein Kow0029_28140 [Candidatus Rifleibacteriota bacterium]
MTRVIKVLAIVALITLLFQPVTVKAGGYRYTKVEPGMPFTYFDIEDIYHQRWVSTYLRGKPIIILTGHRYQRYEILKWAETFRQEYGLPGHVHLLWVVNLRKFPWTTSRGTVIKQWRDFNAPIPVLMDWDGIIGKSLKINYNIPNIIVIDAFGRLALHEMHTYNPEVYAAVSARIRSLLTVNPGYVLNPGIAVPVPLQAVPSPTGKTGDSN